MTITPSVGDSLLQPVMAARDTIAAHSITTFFIVCLCLSFLFNLFFRPVIFTAHRYGVDFRTEIRVRTYAELRPPAGSEADAGDEGEEAERELVAHGAALLVAGEIS